MIVSGHAVKRYIERVRPEIDAITASREIYRNLKKILELLLIPVGVVAKVHYCGVSYVIRACEMPVVVTVYQDSKRDIKHLRDRREEAFLR